MVRGERKWGEEGRKDRGVHSRMVTMITRLFGINLCQDMTERDETGHYHIWALEDIKIYKSTNEAIKLELGRRFLHACVCGM